MAPVVASFVALLALTAGVADAKPLLTPGRHAPHSVANILSTSRRSFHSLMSRYYGTVHGLTKPGPLKQKRSSSIPPGWETFGCVTETQDARLLEGFAFSDAVMTPTLCLTECQIKGYSFAGLEYGDECYCGNSFVGDGGVSAANSACNMGCAGDSSESCGQAWFLSVYTYNSTSGTCADGSTPVASGSPVTVPSATATLSAGDTLATGGLNVTTTARASATGTASASATSSTAASSSAVYIDSDDSSEWYSLGCAVDSETRILNSYSNLAQMDLTIDSCLTTCEDQGYMYAGVEFGLQCFCGSSIPTAISYSASACNMACVGNSSEICGGDYALDLYELVNAKNVSCEANSTVSSPLNSKQFLSGASSASVTKVSTAASAPSSTVASAPASTSVSANSPSVPSSSAPHYVWAHHMVGNTYPYVESDWASDISTASGWGIDGFALNMGSDSWQPDRIADAYSAATGTSFKLFLSLDMTALGCSSASDASNLVNMVKTYASHPNQAMYNSKVLVSTFAGSDCTFGTNSNNGWQSEFVDALSSAGVSIFFVPSLFSDISTFGSNGWMDGELNWNSGWPSSNVDISTASDATYMAALGGKTYMPAISPFFYTHFGANSWNKNWLYRSDDWLYCSRWEEVIAMRANVQMTELLTWNDFGESSYLGPVEGAMPAGSASWVNGFDHTALSSLTAYYSTAFKTGSYPSIGTDEIILWSRPHAHDATASGDSVGQPTGWNWTDDNLYAVVLATAAGEVTLTSGSNSETFSVSAGLNKLKISSSAGTISAQMTRNGNTVASFSGQGSFDYTESPSTYNFNYFVGSSSS